MSGIRLKAIAACVLGGISLSGGVGSLFGASIGALFPPEGEPDDMSRSGRISIRPPTTSSTSRQPPRKIRTEVDIYSNEKKG